MFTRRTLLGGAIAGLGLGLAGAVPGPAQRKLLVIYAHGGWDTSYCLDPKRDSPYVMGPEVDLSNPDDPTDVEEVVRYGDLDIAVNEAKRPSVSRFFERWGERVLVVNGLSIGGIAHYPNRLRMFTGTTDRTRPDVACIVGSRSDPSLPFGSIDLSTWAYSGPLGADLGRFGVNLQFQGVLEPSADHFGELAPPDRDTDALIDKYLRERAEELESHARPGLSTWGSQLSRSLDRLTTLRDRRSELAALLDIQPGSTPDNLMLAVKLLAGGWCRALMVDSKTYFDTHINNADQHDLHDHLFAGLSVTMNDLEQSGELENTLIMVMSEMTRSPQRNDTRGKDHWPVCTFLLAGAGIRGGRMQGRTDEVVQPQPIDLASGELDPNGVVCRYDNFLAGVLAHLDLDPQEWLPGVPPLGGFG